MNNRYKIGTLLEDRGDVGMIAAFLPKGCQEFDGSERINWRDNYQILFANQGSYIIGVSALHRLVQQGQIKIIKK